MTLSLSLSLALSLSLSYNLDAFLQDEMMSANSRGEESLDSTTKAACDDNNGKEI